MIDKDFATAAAAQSLIDRDAGEPAGERGAAFELAQAGEGADVSLLHHVFAFGVVAQDGAGGAVDALVMAAHQDLKQVALAGEHARHDLLVGQWAQRGWFGQDRHSVNRVARGGLGYRLVASPESGVLSPESRVFASAAKAECLPSIPARLKPCPFKAILIAPLKMILRVLSPELSRIGVPRSKSKHKILRPGFPCRCKGAGAPLPQDDSLS